MEINFLKDLYELYSLNHGIDFSLFKGMYENENSNNKSYTHYEQKIEKCQQNLKVEIQNFLKEENELKEKIKKEEIKLKANEEKFKRLKAAYIKSFKKNSELDKKIKELEKNLTTCSYNAYEIIQSFENMNTIPIISSLPTPSAPPSYDEIQKL